MNSLKSISYPLILIFIVLGSILLGIATPTESAALGAVGSTLIALLSKRLDSKILFEVADNSVKITSMVFFILIGASVFSLVLRGYGGDIMVEELTKLADKMIEDLENQKNLDDSIEKYQKLLKLNSLIENKFKENVKDISKKTRENILKIILRKNANKAK